MDSMDSWLLGAEICIYFEGYKETGKTIYLSNKKIEGESKKSIQCLLKYQRKT